MRAEAKYRYLYDCIKSDKYKEKKKAHPPQESAFEVAAKMCSNIDSSYLFDIIALKLTCMIEEFDSDEGIKSISDDFSVHMMRKARSCCWLLAENPSHPLIAEADGLNGVLDYHFNAKLVARGIKVRGIKTSSRYIKDDSIPLFEAKQEELDRKIYKAQKQAAITLGEIIAKHSLSWWV